MLLTALAERVQQWLDKQTPERLQRWRAEIELRKQQRMQRRQDRARQEAEATVAQQRNHSGVEAAAAAAAAAEASAGASEMQMTSALLPHRGVGDACGSSRPVDCSDDVLWWLRNYVICHTEWQSARKEGSQSPKYDGALLEAAVQELLRFKPRHWGE